MNPCPATYPHYAHGDCAGIEQPPGRDLNGGEVYYFEFYHEVDGRYGVSLDDADVVRIWDDGRVEFTDGTTQTYQWDCIREWSDR